MAARSEAGGNEGSVGTPRPRTPPLGGQLRGHPGVPAPPSRRKRPGSWGGVGAELRPARSGGGGALGTPHPQLDTEAAGAAASGAARGGLSRPLSGCSPCPRRHHPEPGRGSVPGPLEPAGRPPGTRPAVSARARRCPLAWAGAGSPRCQESRSRRKVTSHMPYRGRVPGDGAWPRAQRLSPLRARSRRLRAALCSSPSARRLLPPGSPLPAPVIRGAGPGAALPAPPPHPRGAPPASAPRPARAGPRTRTGDPARGSPSGGRGVPATRRLRAAGAQARVRGAQSPPGACQDARISWPPPGDSALCLLQASLPHGVGESP